MNFLECIFSLFVVACVLPVVALATTNITTTLNQGEQLTAVSMAYMNQIDAFETGATTAVSNELGRTIDVEGTRENTEVAGCSALVFTLADDAKDALIIPSCDPSVFTA